MSTIETTLAPTPLDHVALGLSRLRLQFADKPKLAALLTSWLNRSNELEAAMIDVLVLRCIDTATGVQLDTLGNLVGQARGGVADDVYRRYIRARILVNNSSGTLNELLRIAELVTDCPNTGTIFPRCFSDATYIFEIRNFVVTSDVAAVLQSMLCSATSGGVRIVIEYSNVLLASTFRLDVGLGLDAGHFARGIDAKGTP